MNDGAHPLTKKAENITDSESTDSEDQPANESVWVFILGDMCVFSMFFFMYLYYRSGSLELYQQSQLFLNPHYGSINTLLLLASSWLIVMAVIALRRDDTRKCSYFTALAVILGTLFAVLKVFEYREKLQLGIGFEYSQFFTFYYMLTGIHLAHLISGLAILVYLYFSVRARTSSTADQINTFELSAIFWHMVDLLWILIFPLLYLLP